MKPVKLTWRQEVFCQEFVKDYDAKAAALVAKYSETSAGMIGAKNLKKPQIQKRIEQIQDAIRTDAELDPTTMATPKELLQSYTRDIRFDPADMFDADSKPLPIKEVPKNVRLSLTSMDIDEKVLAGGAGNMFEDQVIERKYKFKFPNKNQVRDSISRLMGLTNGNGDVIKTILEAVGLININVQNNQYNIEVTEALQRVIEHHDSKQSA